MKTSKRARFLRIPTGETEGLYELVPLEYDPHAETVPPCPYCKARLLPGYDICQWGMFEDSFASYLLCRGCGKAYELRYTIASYQFFGKRAQKALFPSKKPRVAGSDRRER